MTAWSVCAVDGFGRVLELREWVWCGSLAGKVSNREELPIKISGNR